MISPLVIKEQVEKNSRDACDDDSITKDDLKLGWHILKKGCTIGC